MKEQLNGIKGLQNKRFNIIKMTGVILTKKQEFALGWLK